MGEIEVRGPHALALLQHVTSNDVSRLRDGQAQYSALMLPKGSCVDDCVVHRFTPEQLLHLRERGQHRQGFRVDR